MSKTMSVIATAAAVGITAWAANKIINRYAEDPSMSRLQACRLCFYLALAGCGGSTLALQSLLH
jgi:hypothetical protein